MYNIDILKNKKFLLIAGIVVLVAIAGFLIYHSKNPVNSGPDGIILFYRDGCSHCKIVDDFIAQNKIEEKVKFTSLEVFNNTDNQKILLQKVQVCGLKAEEVGVPFLWDGEGKCFVGDQDVIKFFKDKAGIQ